MLRIKKKTFQLRRIECQLEIASIPHKVPCYSPTINGNFIFYVISHIVQTNKY